MDVEAQVMLTRMEGKIDLLNERHDTFKGDLRDLKERSHSHSNRLGVLEADKHLRQGAASTVRILWIVLSGGGGAVAMAIIAFFFRMKGI